MVTTVIPVFNRPEMLVSAVGSVLAQDYRPIEIIVADDGSTDQTPTVAEQLIEKNPDIIHYVRIENSGPGPAREAGRVIAKGEFIQYLDSDDRLLPNKFADQLAALNQHPDCDIAYGITRLVDEQGTVISEPFKWTDRKIDALFPGLLVDRWWCTHTPLYRRSLTDQIGPWCDMRWSQDWEYDARAGALGAKLVHCPTLVSEHVHHAGVRQTSGADWGRDPVRLRNRFDLLTTLWKNATKAGLPGEAQERQHFARWCFRIARQCGAVGLKSESAELLRVAKKASGQGVGSRGLAAYSAVGKMLGSRVTGRLATWLENYRVRPGKSTMNQSFEGQVGEQE